MAQLTRATELHPDVQYHLTYQFNAWGSLQEYERWWKEMTPDEREAFYLEWIGVTESRLRSLEAWAGQGLLATDEQTRFRQLLELVSHQRPILARLFEE